MVTEKHRNPARRTRRWVTAALMAGGAVAGTLAGLALTVLAESVFCRRTRSAGRKRWTAGWITAVMLTTGSCGPSDIVHRSADEILADPALSWLSDTTRHARVHYVAGSVAPESVALVKQGVERAILSAYEFLGGGGDPSTIDVFLVPERGMVGRLGRLRGEANALNFWETRVVIAWLTARGWATPHEYVHVLASSEWGDTAEWWLGEGLAVAAGRWRGQDVHAYASCLALDERLYPMEEMIPRPRSGLDPYVAYPQAGSFVRYLIERYGKDRAREIYPAGASAAQRVYGRSIEGLAEEWRAALAEVASPEDGCVRPDDPGP